jgi:hypothetical protein
LYYLVGQEPVSKVLPADIENVEIVFKDGAGYDTNKLLDSVKGHYGEYQGAWGGSNLPVDALRQERNVELATALLCVWPDDETLRRCYSREDRVDPSERSHSSQH